MPRYLVALILLALPRLAAAQTIPYAFVPGLGTNTVSVIDTTTRAVVATVPTGASPTSATPSPDGRWVYVTNQSSATVTVIDALARTVFTTIPTTGMSPFALAFTPDGRKAFVTQQDPQRYGVIDVATHTFLGPPVSLPLPASTPARTIAMAPDGATAWIVADSALFPVDTTTNALGTMIAVPGFHIGIAITPDGTTAFLGDGSGVQVVDLITRTVLPPIAIGDTRNLAISPDGRFLYAVNLTNSLTVIDVASRTVVTTVSVGNLPVAVAFTPDGHEAYVTDNLDHNVSVVDVASHTAVATIPVGGNPVGHGGRFISAPFVVPTGGPYVVDTDDAGLFATGFRRFVPFAGGTMRLTAGLASDRTFSLLAPGGTMDTNGLDADITGGLVGPGTLTKTGDGTLGLSGPISHGATVLSAGALRPLVPHLSPLSMTGGELHLIYPAGDITATGGRILLADDLARAVPAGVVTLGPGGTLRVDLLGAGGPGAANGHDQLQAASIALNGATLEVQAWFPPAVGASFVIATNATGTFADRPEGAIFAVDGRSYAISYTGGDGNDVVLTRVNTPPFISLPSPTWATNENTPAAPIAFMIGDRDGDTTLSVTATSSDEEIVPASGIVLENTGTNWILRLTPRFGARGLVTISVTVSDGAASTTATVALTVAGGTYLLTEGATGWFFDTDILIVNPNATEAPISIHFLRSAGAPIVQTRTLAPMSRTTIAVDQIPGLEDASFSTLVTSHTFGLPLVVERTMRWGEGGYGASSEKAAEFGTAPTWFFAEGAQGFFSTFFLLVNPQAVANTAHVYFLREGLPVVQRDYALAPGARFTLDAGTVEELRNTAFGAVVDFDRPGAAERSMYFGEQPMWSGGTAAAGMVFPFTQWYFAEGATGSYFTTFLLLANPNPVEANVTIRYLPETGAPVTRTFTIPPLQRVTRNIATEAASLANAAVASEVTSSQPIIAERAQYWGTGTWIDGHASAGDFNPERKWGLAEGRVGGADNAQTYILLANPGALAATVTVTFIRENGGTLVKTFTVPPASRFNVGITGPGSPVPELADERFGALIESTQPISVERSMYSDAGGVTWAAGTNATATFVP